MSARSLLVLKLGGSVLGEPADVERAVHEIYAHVRRGWRVLAVLSARRGATDALLREAHALSEEPEERALAELVGTGETGSVAAMAIALDAAGIASRALDARAAGLVARGSTLDATLAGCDGPAIERAFRRARVVLVPGFVARGRDGAPCLLGRGGSDLTAVFLAARLGARRARLVKDVDGLLERDPALPGPRPRRFASIDWRSARALGGRIVQAKALELAERESMELEIAALGSRSGTLVGRGPTVLAPARAAPPPLRVALAGLGSVGGGVWRALRASPASFECAGVLVRDRARHAATTGDRTLLVAHERELLERPADVLVELTGSIEPARRWIESALERGRHVVTANKALLARDGAELERRARAAGRLLRSSAAVGGAMPVLETARRLGRRGLRSIEGVLNGTSSFVLDALLAGATRDAALAEARARGFAEADPRLDLDGSDVAHKLVCLARAAFGDELARRWERCDGILDLPDALLAAARGRGRSIRLIGSVRRDGDALALSVAPRVLLRSHALAARGTWNAARLVCDDGTEELLEGRGAGRRPSTEAVLADLLDVARWTARLQRSRDTAVLALPRVA